MTKDRIVWDYYSCTRDDDTTTIECGRHLDLTPDLVPATHHARVYADSISLTGDIILPGKELTIFARVFTSNGHRLSVSGNPGLGFAEGQVEKVVTQAGQKGPDGQPGGTGGAGGDLLVVVGETTDTILLFADGGAGGRGQDGGNGATGGIGPNGKDYATHRDLERGNSESIGAPGGKGLRGGGAGSGGDGGVGGDAGVMTLISPRSATPAVSSSLAGGSGGAGGLAGKPGRGGPPGLGGRSSLTIVVHHHDQDDTYETKDKGRNGANFGNGDVGDAAPAGNPGVPGKASELAARSGQSVWSEIGEFASATQAGMALLKAQNDYVAGRYVEAAAVLAWLRFIGRDATDKVLHAIHERASILLTQLRHGLDYFGFPHGYVPLVTVGALDGVIKALLDVAAPLEKLRDELSNAQLDRAERRELLDRVVDTAEYAAVQTENTAKLFDDDILKHRTLCESLLDELITLQRQLMSADDEFKRAVLGRGVGKCDLGRTITIVKTVVSVIRVVMQDYVAIISLAEGLNEIGEDNREDWAKYAEYVRHIEAAEDAGKDLVKRFDSIEELNTEEHPDRAKILVDQEKFRNALQPYMDMKEAQQYLALMERFVQTAQTRNKALLEMTMLIIRRHGAAADVSMYRSQAAATRELIAKDIDPIVGPFALFVNSSLRRLKDLLIEMFYYQQRALDYFTLDVAVRSSTGLALYADDRIDTLALAGAEATVRQFRAMDRRSRDAQPATNMIWRLTKEQIATLQARGRVLFTIPLDAFDGDFSELVVATARLITTGMSGRVSYRLTHCGDPALRRTDGTELCFSHRPRVTQIVIADDKTGQVSLVGVDENLGGSESYAYLSPYATWELEISKNQNAKLDTSKLQDVVLQFDGKFFSRL